MSKKMSDEKLKTTIEKHQADEELIKKTMDSTANKKIQKIFDKSMSDEDTKQTVVSLKDKNSPDNSFDENKNPDGIILDLGENSQLRINTQENVPEEDSDELDFEMDEEEDDDSDKGLKFGPSDSSPEVNKNESSLDDIEIEFKLKEGSINQRPAIPSVGDKPDNLLEALAKTKSREAEFSSEDDSENISLDDIFEEIEDDELSPTMVDIKKGQLKEADESETVSRRLDCVNIESEIIEQKEPSFNAMPEGFQEERITKALKDVKAVISEKIVNSSDDEFLLDDDDLSVENEITKQDHKEFDFSRTEEKVAKRSDEVTAVDKTSALHQLEKERRQPTLPKVPAMMEDNDDQMATQVTGFYQDEFEDGNESSPIDHSSGESTRVLSDKDISAQSRPEMTFNESEMLKHQTTIRILRDDRKNLLSEIEDLKIKNSKLTKDNINLKAQLDEIQIELTIIRKRHEEDINELKYNLNYSEDKKKILEEKLKKNQEELSQMGERVRVDLDKLRRKEKELENQLELVQMDTANQVQNRENKILELKRKIDALEFNMENTQLKEQKAREDKKKLEERLRSIMKTLRGSIRLLEEDLDEDTIMKGLENL